MGSVRFAYLMTMRRDHRAALRRDSAKCALAPLHAPAGSVALRRRSGSSGSSGSATRPVPLPAARCPLPAAAAPGPLASSRSPISSTPPSHPTTPPTARPPDTPLLHYLPCSPTSHTNTAARTPVAPSSPRPPPVVHRTARSPLPRGVFVDRSFRRCSPAPAFLA